jgi:5'-nucleotidase
MRILISNDDGIGAAGLEALATEMANIAHVVVVAPDRNQSASSHSLTLHRPLRVTRVAKDRYAVDGTPTDCVTLAVGTLLDKKKPDLILSGINHGPNMGEDVMYSGTVAAAFEGHVNHIPSIAVSQADWQNVDLRKSAHFVRRFVESLPQILKMPDLLLNLNIPKPGKGGLRAFKITRLGHRVYDDVISEKLDPRGRKYYWIAGKPAWTTQAHTDHAAVMAGKVSVTPLRMDYTHYDLVNELQSWSLKPVPKTSAAKKRRRK